LGRHHFPIGLVAGAIVANHDRNLKSKTNSVDAAYINAGNIRVFADIANDKIEKGNRCCPFAQNHRVSSATLDRPVTYSSRAQCELGAETLISTFFSAGPPFRSPPFQTTNANRPTIMINAIAQMALLAALLPSSAIMKSSSSILLKPTLSQLANRMPI
jgi:hypothetical protein